MYDQSIHFGFVPCIRYQTSHKKQIRFDHLLVLYIKGFWLYISHVDVKLRFYIFLLKKIHTFYKSFSFC